VVWFRSGLLLDRFCMKRLSEHHLPRFDIGDSLLLDGLAWKGWAGSICPGLESEVAPPENSSIRHPEDAPLRRCIPARDYRLYIDYMYRLLVLYICIVVELDFHHKDNTWEKSIFLGVSHICPLPEGGGAPALPNFWGSLLSSMHAPFDAEQPNLTWQYVGRGLVFRGPVTPHSKLAGSQHSPNF